ncbi:hypothetical protein ACGLHS_06980 [Variovorax sp. VaC1]|uniref:hypothetical protein n=1 Tax=Variovorax sp. VaC1 TaxID=3373132 RepID=UPI0037484D01
MDSIHDRIGAKRFFDEEREGSVRAARGSVPSVRPAETRGLRFYFSNFLTCTNQEFSADNSGCAPSLERSRTEEETPRNIGMGGMLFFIA